MKKNYTKAMSSAMVMSLILTAALPTTLVRAASGEVTRVGEADSYATAARVATLNWSNPKDVVLVCGEGYADAVSATVLAKQLDAPILLTTASSLSKSAKDALDTLKPENIYVIGGNASVSKIVRDGLKDSKYNLVELSGKDRYETNIAVAKQLVKLGVSADNVILVSGEGFSDTLSVTSVAAAKNQILLLGTNDKTSMKPVLDFVKSSNSKVTVVGTSYSINDATYKSLNAVKRVNGGADRFATNLNVLSEFGEQLSSTKLFVANASEDRYADALIASSLAGKWSTPLVLVDSENSEATDKAINYIKGKINSLTDLNVIGNLDAVSDNVISKINGAVPIVDSPTVKSISTNGLNQIKVVFNTDVDEDSAELMQNYQIDGANLNSVSAANITLQDDKRTVLITISKSFEQYKEVTFTVKNTILSKNLTDSIAKFEQKITFFDIEAPRVESVTSHGGNKLTVKFSEPIRMSVGDLSSIKINRQSITNYSLNTASGMTVFKNRSGMWTDTVELYFDSPLPTGTNILSIPNGDRGSKFDDAAGFTVKGTSLSFNVDSQEGTPKVTSVTGDNSGNIYIRYDRPMDKQTALEGTNYKINGNTNYISSSDIAFDEGSSDEVVKIKGLSYLLKDGENEVIIKRNVKDTYGNEIDETKMTFNIGTDSIKPQVTNVSLIDDDTIRVKFNKDVSNSYATNRSNYKLIDSDGTDVTYKIDYIKSVYMDGNDKRTFDINFQSNNDLKGSKFTLTIKNIADTNSTSNVMDTYTTVISGLADGGPKVTSIVKVVDDDQSLVIFFDKTMDQSSLCELKNYQFMNGKGEGQRLPTSTVITPSSDNKSVTIEFPTSYVIDNGTEERSILKMSVSNVRDKDGNLLEAGTYSGSISMDYNNGPKLIDNTAKLTYEGDDIKVRFSLTAPLDTLVLSDFRVNSQVPDSCTMIGNDIILTFKAGVKNNEKINNIKNGGSSTTLTISGRASADAAGRSLRTGSDTILLPPTTVSDSWRADSNKSSGTNSTVTIVFNQDIDSDIQSSYSDDFIFTNERTGQRLNVLSVSIDGKNVTYKFNTGSIIAGDRISIKANSDVANINIRSKKRSNGDYSVYSPSRDDLGTRTITAR
ncbi:cell wall-binding repeat-containing protein [Clostridium sp. CX1]|uniref:cell wall-binding repeat-containing protein n=1 Tax=Clostridium sp. CX1 TaxID=2978346 RepID=UPI0021C18581|nr:cell wall-binding repeat-containing protein [Clostridium sp. CX1]MCT8978544.1 cell wall-binding repeat-containing protein [Clostridium sp. CX1]